MRMSRRWLIAGAIGLGAIALAVIGLGIVYPRLGSWMIKKRAGEKIAAKLGRDLHFGKIDVSIGHAVLHDVEIRGPLDGDTPLLHIDRIDVEFDGWKSLYGKLVLGPARVDGVIVTLRRTSDGRDNVRDVIDRLRAPADPAAPPSPSGPGNRPTSVTVSHVRVLA